MKLRTKHLGTGEVFCVLSSFLQCTMCDCSWALMLAGMPPVHSKYLLCYDKTAVQWRTFLALAGEDLSELAGRLCTPRDADQPGRFYRSGKSGTCRDLWQMFSDWRSWMVLTKKNCAMELQTGVLWEGGERLFKFVQYAFMSNQLCLGFI